MVCKTTLKTFFSFFIISLLASALGFGQTILTEGDIAITGVNSEGTSDQFSFVLLTDVSNNTEIHFTDHGWLEDGGFRNPSGEGIVTWTATSDLTCGTEIIIENIATSTFSSSTGTAIQTSGIFLLAGTNGDQILAFQGALSEPTFLYAIHFGNANSWTDADDTNNSAVPAGLTDGVNAIDMGNYENGTYNCTVTTNLTLILEAIANVSNWTTHNTTRQTLGNCSYTVCVGSCVSTVTWNGTWNGSPDLTTEVIIDAPYNTATEGSFKACSLTVSSGIRLTVNNGTYVEVENNVTVDGELWVETQGNFVQNESNGTFTVNLGGESRVNKQTATKNAWYYYTYWSSPVIDWTIAEAFPDAPANRRFLFNASNYLDTDGNGIDDNGDDWQIALAGDIMQPGVGYAATESLFFIPGGTGTATFVGNFNTGDIETSIVYNPANISGSWNLIGNPYPSAIDFIAFQQANSSVIDGAAYFWSQASPPDASNPGNQVLNFSQNDYAVFTVGSGGAAGASGITPNKYIPSGQGFFIAGIDNGNATFTNAMRMADGSSNNQFFKAYTSKNNKLENKLWVNLTSDNGVFNQILVAYVDGATNDDDGLSYDAPRIFIQDLPSALYTEIENSNKKFAIQGKAATSLGETETIKLGFTTNIDLATLYTLSIAQLQGDFLSHNAIYLKDNLLNKVHDLKACDYTFTSEVGEFNERFVIMFNNTTLSADKVSLESNTLNIVDLSNDLVEFSTSNNLKINSVSIFDLMGRELYKFKGQNSTEIYNLSKLKTAFYVAKVKLSNGVTVSKKAVKK
ncbi:T9SS type A sorting domain-containing protein [Flavobacteriaceae bacterium XHP0103]|uniref:T9SS type A sorting domain-containing protein n=1 Tax=Marixanthotalea marina TaxID=2844359 RepID=UPI002989F219|nr:T9SS type A sorting domain-containing protein [Marixanthotalea marina]MBU3820789.1 T9SS type A sorting domain-containing protein [Marixanthotalea marina]